MPISPRPAFVLLGLCLFALGCSSATDRLLAQLGDPDPKVRGVAARALGESSMDAGVTVPALVKALDDREPTVRLAVALAIAKIDPRNESYVPVLTESLLVGHGPVFVEVGRMGADAKWALPTLVKLLSDQRASIRALAAQTLGQIVAGKLGHDDVGNDHVD